MAWAVFELRSSESNNDFRGGLRVRSPSLSDRKLDALTVPPRPVLSHGASLHVLRERRRDVRDWRGAGVRSRPECCGTGDLELDRISFHKVRRRGRRAGWQIA